MLQSQSGIALLHLTALILGASLGLFFDVLRLPRRLLFGAGCGSSKANPPKKHSVWQGIAVFAEDFLFCVFAAVAMILLFYERNNGKVRPFSFLVAFAGFWLYRVTLGKPFAKLTELAARALRRAVRAFLRTIAKPLKKAGNAVCKRWKTARDAVRERTEKQERNRYTKAQTRAAATTACGLLPEDGRLRAEQAEETGTEKKKRRNPHGGTEKGTKNHRAKQKSMA